jgi:hypothetical protein
MVLLDFDIFQMDFYNQLFEAFPIFCQSWNIQSFDHLKLLHFNKWSLMVRGVDG